MTQRREVTGSRAAFGAVSRWPLKPLSGRRQQSQSRAAALSKHFIQTQGRFGCLDVWMNVPRMASAPLNGPSLSHSSRSTIIQTSKLFYRKYVCSQPLPNQISAKIGERGREPPPFLRRGKFGCLDILKRWQILQSDERWRLPEG